MLGKLFKYEMKATARNILPLYALILIFSLLNNFFMFTDLLNGAEWVKVIGIAMLVVLCIALFVIMAVIFIQRFYKNLFKDEGYLTFTLPVTTHEIVLSKLFSSIVWILATVVVAMASIFLFTVGHGFYKELFANWDSIWYNFIIKMPAELKELFVPVMLEFPLAFLNSILMIYFCLTVGNTLFPKAPIAMSVVTYIATSFVLNIISVIVIITTEMVNTINPTGLLLYDISMQCVMIAFYYFATVLLLKNKLNLQ